MQRLFVDRLVALSATQHHLFSVDQAHEIGVSNSMLDGAVERGWIRRERRGVFSVAGAQRSKWQDIYGAALATGPPAAVSHSSAARIHGFYGIVGECPELILPWNLKRNLEGVKVHHSRTLRPGDIDVRHEVRVTTPIRTIIDLAPRLPHELLGIVLDEGAIGRLWTAEQVMARVDSLPPGTPGVTRLVHALQLRTGERNPDSRLEQRVLRVVKPVYPGYQVHHRVTLDGQVIEMDIAWIEAKIDGEVDGFSTRAVSRSKFERSSRRENLLAAHGWRIVHFTHQMDDATILAQLAPFFSTRIR